MSLDVSSLDTPAPAAEPVGLRERKKERTRRLLADVALDLFETHGFERTTVDDIAAAADVSPRTFFRYFATKDEALFDRAGDAQETFRALLAARPADEPLLVALREIGVALIGGDLVEADRVRRVLTIAHREPALRSRFEALMATVEAELTVWAAGRLGVTPSDMRPRLLAAAVLAARRVAMDIWLESPGEDLSDQVAQAIDLLASGLTDGA
jgi:AcrR family transcriptional regulator